jgi:NF-X1-type zinc finger protein NFXL1
MKPLDPDCGHKCLLLCHPFTHPPCAQIIQKSCGCGKSPLRTIRCSQKHWSCGKKCGKLLSCNLHVCENECHESDCSPCKNSRDLSCQCGSSKKKIKCEKAFWSCEKRCGRKFSCGVHLCEEKCHSGGFNKRLSTASGLTYALYF